MPQSSTFRSTSPAPAIFTFFVILLLTFLAIRQVQPPSPGAASAPLEAFSAARAYEHLKIIAQRPHPTGSAENVRVREYLASQLGALGLDPQVQTATAVRGERKWRGPASAATVNNLVARIRGTANTRALMLAAHYDSVPSGPGASDDGSGTVTLLETARALKAGAPLRNDVIFLFTDAEEAGLLGAQAFVEEHPWAKDIAVTLNFDARGACGASYMFETSPGNGWLIRQLAGAAPHAQASSLMYDLYKRLPNDTDFTVFKRAGIVGLNFAYAGCWPRYHTLRDDIEDIDLRSLQHDGSYALSLAHRFGNLDLRETRGEDAVYFSLFGGLVHYGGGWVAPLTVLALLLYIGVAAVGLKKRHLTWRGLALGVAGWAVAAVLAVGVPQLLWMAVRRTSLVSTLPYHQAYNGDLYAYGFMALAIAISSAAYLLLARKTRVENLTLGALLWWLLLSGYASVDVPGGSYLFTWPLLFSLIELGYSLARREPESEAATALIWTLPAIVGILLVGPIPYLLLELLGAGGLITILAGVALLVGLLVPHIQLMTTHAKWLLPGAAASVAVALIVAAIARSGYDAKDPKADSVVYSLNFDTNKALWVSSDKAVDDWTAQFFQGRAQNGDLFDFFPFHATLLEAPAPVIPANPPHITVMDDLTMGELRLLRLSITSPRQARVMWVEATSGTVVDASINGKPIPGDSSTQAGGAWGLTFTGVPNHGIVLSLEARASLPLTLKVTDMTDGLPEIPGATLRPRPNDRMPSPWAFFESSTLTSKTFGFEARP